MVVISRYTGKEITDYEHTIESLITIFTTPKMTRLYRRAFGANVLDLQDRPITDDLKIDIYQILTTAAIAEPRFKLEQASVNTEEAQDGHLYVDIYGLYKPNNQYIKLEGLKLL